MKKSIRFRARELARFSAPALSVLSLAVVASVQAQELQSLNPIQMNVTASRIPTAVKETLGDITVMDRAQIESSGVTSISELLGLIPGVQVTPSSVRGETASIFIRGTNNNHTLFLVDGQRVSSATTGATAFAHLPLSQIDRVEVLRGPSSSLYGSDAIGGVIQVFTKQGGDSQPVPSFYAGVGQYGTFVNSASYGGRLNDTTFHAQVGYENTRGISQIKAPKSGQFDAYNADRDGYRQTNVGLNLSQKLTSDLVLKGSYLYSNSLKHTDNANCDASWTVCTSNFDNRDRQTLETGAVDLTWKVSPLLKSNFRVGRTTDRLESLEFDPVAATVSVPKFRTVQDQYAWVNELDVGIGKIMSALEWRGVNVNSTKALDKTKQNTSSVALGYQGSVGNHLFQANIRRDEVTDLEAQNTGSAGYGYRLTRELVVRGNIGTAFHAPTFNDLYWPLDPINFYQGNPNLKPETSLNREIGIHYEKKSSAVGLTFYKNRVSNLIAYYTDPNTFMGTMNNIGTADIQGATMHYAQAISNWNFKISYDALSAKDRETGHALARRAPRSGAFDLERVVGPLRTGLRIDAVSQRFNNSTNTQVLSGYAVLGLRTSYAIKSDLRLEANLNNLLNRDYVVMRGTVSPYNDYAMPGRSLYVGIRYSPK